MKIFPAAVFAVLLLLLPVCASRGGTASLPDQGYMGSRNEDYMGRTNSAQTVQAKGFASPRGTRVDGNQQAESGQEPAIPLQPWYTLLSGNMGEEEEPKTTALAQQRLQGARQKWTSAMDALGKMNSEDLRELASAQAEKLLAQRQSLFSRIQLPAVVTRLMNDPAIRKDAMEMAFGVAGMGAASLVSEWSGVPMLGTLALYLTGLMALTQGAKNMGEKIVADEEVSAAIANAAAAARLQVKKLLNLNRQTDAEPADEAGTS